MVAIEEETYFPRGGVQGDKQPIVKHKKPFSFENRQVEKSVKKKPGKREREKLRRLEQQEDIPKFTEVEPLNYLTICEGLLSICCLSEINADYLNVKLPCLASGIVQINQISTPFLKHYNESLSKTGLMLDNYFKKGQIFPCKVMSNKRESHNNKINVSLDPAEVNSGINFKEICKGRIIVAAVSSQGDHGYTLFSGIKGVITFLPNDNAEKYVINRNDGKPLVPGQLIWCKITKSELGEQTNITEVTIDPKKISKPVPSSDLASDWIYPGLMVNATITEVGRKNILITLNDSELNGVMYPPLSKKLTDFNTGDEITATVSYKFPFVETPAFGFDIIITEVSKQEIQNGTVIERAKVLAVSKARVVLQLQYDGKQFTGLISKRRFPKDADFSQIEQLFPLGNCITVKVLSFDYLEKVYSCSTEDHLLQAKYLVPQDVKVGELVDVKIEEKRDNGYVVKIGLLKGFVPLSQIADEPLSKRKNYLAIHSEHKGRVLKLAWDVNCVLVTLKPALVNNKPLTQINHAKEGEFYYGTVTSIFDDKIVVSFFGHVTAPIFQLNLMEPLSKYSVGQLVKCFVCKKKSGKPYMSLVKPLDHNVRTGKSYPLIITQITPDGLDCLGKEKGSTFKAIIPTHHLNDHPYLWGFLLKQFKVGLTIKDAYLYNHSYGIPIFTLKKSVKLLFEENKKLVEVGLQLLKVGMTLPCTITKIHLNEHENLEVATPVPMFHSSKFVSFQDVTSNFGSVTYFKNQPINLEVKNTDNQTFFSLHSISNLKINKQWCIENLQQFLNCLSSHQNFAVGDNVNVILKKKLEHCIKVALPNNREGYVIRKVPKNVLSKNAEFQATVLYDDVLNNRVILIHQNGLKPEKDECRSGDEKISNSEKVLILYCNSIFMLGIVEETQKFIYIPSMDVRNFYKPTLFFKGTCDVVSEWSEGNIAIGYPCKRKLFTQSEPSYVLDETDLASCQGIGDSSVAVPYKSQVQKSKQNTTKPVQFMEIPEYVAEDTNCNQNIKRKISEIQSDESTSDNETRVALGSGNLKRIRKEIHSTDELNSFLSIPEYEVDNSEEQIKQSKYKVESGIDNNKLFGISEYEDGSENNDNANEMLEDTLFGVSEYGDDKKCKTENQKLKKIDQNKSKIENTKSKKKEKVKSQNVSDNNASEIHKKLNTYLGKRSVDSTPQSVLAIQIKKKKLESAKALSLEAIGGFDWDATPSDLSKAIIGDTKKSDNEDSDEEDKTPKKKLTPAEKKAAALEAEKKLREKEDELIQAENNPKSAEHFDRLVLGEPNNSKRWVQYMAFHLQSADIDKARSVAKRALKTINIREEQERLNVWIALLNLDQTYSPVEVFQETLSEALKYNDDYIINSRVLDMYVDSGKSSEVEQLANHLARKYRDKLECWLHCQQALLAVGLAEKARFFLQRSLSSLRKKDHITLLSRFALLENKHGFHEQAQSLFETLLTSYPQRVDLWNVYVDMLIKSKSIGLARNVLERIPSHKLPVRKMKSLYKKWLSFEEAYGTPKSVLDVKMAAEKYADDVTSKEAENKTNEEDKEEPELQDFLENDSDADGEEFEDSEEN